MKGKMPMKEKDMMMKKKEMDKMHKERMGSGGKAKASKRGKKKGY